MIQRLVDRHNSVVLFRGRPLRSFQNRAFYRHMRRLHGHDRGGAIMDEMRRLSTRSVGVKVVVVHDYRRRDNLAH